MKKVECHTYKSEKNSGVHPEKKLGRCYPKKTQVAPYKNLGRFYMVPFKKLLRVQTKFFLLRVSGWSAVCAGIFVMHGLYCREDFFTATMVYKSHRGVAALICLNLASHKQTKEPLCIVLNWHFWSKMEFLYIFFVAGEWVECSV